MVFMSSLQPLTGLAAARHNFVITQLSIIIMLPISESIVHFEIPAADDFRRAIEFYEEALDWNISDPPN